MAKSKQSKDNKQPPQGSELFPYIFRLILGFLVLVGVIATAYFSYLGNVEPVTRVIEATEKAEAERTGIPLTLTSLFLAQSSAETQFARATLTVTYQPIASTPDLSLNETATALSNQLTSISIKQTELAITIISPTLNPSIPQGSCDNFNPPCSYTIKVNDNYSYLAEEFYNDVNRAIVIINYNRDANGKVKSLNINDIIFIPAITALPKLPYIECEITIAFPCQYVSMQNDSFEKIAELFYGDTKHMEFLKIQNPIFTEKYIPEKTLLVLPPLP